MKFAPGSLALVRGSFEQVEVISQMGPYVLVKRAGGQAGYVAEQLEPYDPDYCPLD
jgi:hypothetical protein